MFIENKYTKWYYQIVQRRQNQTTDGYTERHHVVPKSLGGTNQSTNVVRLTAREHFICHRLLTKMTNGIDKQKMFLALDCFTKYICPGRPDIRITSAIFAEARSQSAQYLKSIRKGNATRPAGTYRHTDATKSKQSASALGLVKRPAGFTHPEETINKMCANRKGKGLGNIPWNKGLVQVCPHCSKVVKGTLNRWHGDRCKFKPA